jgi:ferredoxin
VGWLIDTTILRGMSLGTAKSTHLTVWWLHAILVGLLFATLPVNRFLHIITGPLNIATRPNRPMGALIPLTMEEVEQTGRTGVNQLADFTQSQLLSLDACMECGRCEEACPATASGKPLSPKAVVVDLRRLMSLGGGDVHEDHSRRDSLVLHDVSGLRAGMPGAHRTCRSDQ